jgi:hypothetical protein
MARLGKIQVVEGHEDVDVLSRRIRTNSIRYRECYERALEKNGELEGRVEARERGIVVVETPLVFARSY